MSTCEICGKRATRLSKVSVEGAVLTVCENCRELGEVVREVATPPRKPMEVQRISARGAGARVRIGVGLPSVKGAGAVGFAETELVRNYGQVVKRAREGLGLSHHVLGLKISEKASVIQKIEAGKLVPDDVLAGKLEHALKIKLLVKPSTPVVEVPKEAKPRVLTLGDIVKVKDKKAE